MQNDTLIYNRQISVDVRSLDEVLYLFTGRLHIRTEWSDGVALYEMWEKIKLDDAVVIDAGVNQLHIENEGCRSTPGLVRQLIGVKLDQTYLWRASRVLGKHDGCQHLFELAVEIGRAFSNLCVYMFSKMDNPPGYVSNFMFGENRNRCIGIGYELQNRIRE